jgi:hypothetical protein
MWQRLGEVCEALTDAGEGETLRLWRELSGGLLAQACRSAVRDGAIAQPMLTRCVDHLERESLIGQLSPLLNEIQRWDRDDTEDIVREAREEIEGSILAILALRCGAGEPDGPELLRWASRRCDPEHPLNRDLEPVHPERPVSWIEACVPPLFLANIGFAEWAGNDRLDTYLRVRLEPALRRLREHDLDEFLSGANPSHVAALQRLLLVCPPSDIRDLNSVLNGEGEIRLSRWSTRTSGDDLLTLSELVASDDVRVRLLSLMVMVKVLDDCASSLLDPPSRQLHIPLDLPNALDAARADPHPVIAGLAVCAVVQMGHPAHSTTSAVQLLGDPTPVVRAAAARTLGRVAEGANWGDALAPLLGDSNASVRLAAVEAVRMLKEPVASPTVLTYLLPRLDDTDHDIRVEAIEAAGALGPALTEAFIERLAVLTGEESEVVRMRSIAALSAAKHSARRPATFNALVDCFDDNDSCVVECALRAYADLDGPTDATVLERVTALLEEERSKGVKKAAATLLTKMGHFGGSSSLSSPP